MVYLFCCFFKNIFNSLVDKYIFSIIKFIFGSGWIGMLFLSIVIVLIFIDKIDLA